MKKIVLFLLLITASVFAAELETAQDYKSAVELAKKENKNILLMLSQYGCPACKYMLGTTLKNDEVKAALSNYIFVDVDIYEGTWNKKYRAFGTPTIYFLDKNENKIGRNLIGAQDPDTFVKFIAQNNGAKK